MDYTNILNAIYSRLGEILSILTSSKSEEYIQVIIAILLLGLIFKLTRGI